jgi:hypothetical protein
MMFLGFAFNLASAAASEDLDELESLQTLVSDIGGDFITLSTRFRVSGEELPFMVSNHFASETLLIALEIEQVKDAIVGLGVLNCDEASQRYFRDVATSRFGKHGIVAFLTLRMGDIAFWQSLSRDAALIDHANRLKAVLQRVEDMINALQLTYALGRSASEQ